MKPKLVVYLFLTILWICLHEIWIETWIHFYDEDDLIIRYNISSRIITYVIMVISTVLIVIISFRKIRVNKLAVIPLFAIIFFCHWMNSRFLVFSSINCNYWVYESPISVKTSIGQDYRGATPKMSGFGNEDNPEIVNIDWTGSYMIFELHNGTKHAVLRSFLWWEFEDIPTPVNENNKLLIKQQLTKLNSIKSQFSHNVRAN
jgi:hypothetical protein